MHARIPRVIRDAIAISKITALIPFVRLWCGEQSLFQWRADSGQLHAMRQGDGGEQGHGFMPALFCLALHDALEELRRMLPPGTEAIMYLDDIYILCDPGELSILRNWPSGVPAPDPCPADQDPTVAAAWKSDKPPDERGIVMLNAPLCVRGQNCLREGGAARHTSSAPFFANGLAPF
eukprot:1163880-Pyramimonas_sp.AAC.1